MLVRSRAILGSVAVHLLLITCAWAGNPSWGGYFAVNSSSIAYDEQFLTIDKAESRLGYTGGLEAEWRLGKSAGLAAQIRFAKLNQRVVLKREYGDGFFEYNSSYLSIPVTYRFGFGQKRAAFLELGPELGFLVAAHTKENYENELGVHDRSTDIKDDMASVVFSALLGAGYEFSAAGRLLGIRFRYSLGLSAAEDPEQWASHWKLNEFSVGVWVGI